MRQLNHQNITKLIDFRETPDYYFIVLELIPGGELFHQIVRLTYFSEDLSRHVILQVAEAVRYLHEVAGVVHRDIKPENLLFYPSEFVPSKVKTVRKGEDANKVDEGEFIPGVGAGGIGVIKLADFGLSKIIWDSKTMTPCGTVGYTAPEIVKDERYSKSVDMWALGCVLYTILCGFPPFYDESIEVLTAKVAKGQFSFLSPWWDEISVEAKDLVSHLLEVDPEKRYTIDEFLAHPWIQKGIHDHPVQMNIDSFSQVLPTPGPPTAQIMTPAAATLKEVFDVSNAVYRMENDNRRANPFTANNNVTIVEEEEVEGPIDGGLYIGGKPATAMDQVQQGMEKVSMRARKAPVETANPVGSSRRNRQQAAAAQHGGFFELNLDGATLLGRRRQQNTQDTAPAIQSFS